MKEINLSLELKIQEGTKFRFRNTIYTVENIVSGNGIVQLYCRDTEGTLKIFSPELYYRPIGEPSPPRSEKIIKFPRAFKE